MNIINRVMEGNVKKNIKRSVFLRLFYLHSKIERSSSTPQTPGTSPAKEPTSPIRSKPKAKGRISLTDILAEFELSKKKDMKEKQDSDIS